jgi:hypothetical protein
MVPYSFQIQRYHVIIKSSPRGKFPCLTSTSFVKCAKRHLSCTFLIVSGLFRCSLIAASRSTAAIPFDVFKFSKEIAMEGADTDGDTDGADTDIADNVVKLESTDFFSVSGTATLASKAKH